MEISKVRKIRATMELEDGEVIFCRQCDTLFREGIAHLDIDDEDNSVEGVYCPSCVSPKIPSKKV